MEQVLKIAHYVAGSFIHIWPYLLITIPLAVTVQLSGASGYITKAMSRQPILSVFLATVVGAFSPFCSCGVIPVITSLLIGGVPLAPVMSFWIASPSMDPEIFFLSTGAIGWKLSVWRLASTFLISLLSGYITYFLTIKGYLPAKVLRTDLASPDFLGISAFLKKCGETTAVMFSLVRQNMAAVLVGRERTSVSRNVYQCCTSTQRVAVEINDGKTGCGCVSLSETAPPPFRVKLFNETRNAVWMVVKFMTLAFVLNALLIFYVPAESISKMLGGNGASSVIIATLVGIPAYTSNITALPLISSLLSLGMSPAAALSFLIAGPTTTLPALVAVWGIASRKVFYLYILLAVAGAMLSGFAYLLLN